MDYNKAIDRIGIAILIGVAAMVFIVLGAAVYVILRVVFG